MTLYLEFHNYQIMQEMRSQKLDTVPENGKMRVYFGKLFEIALHPPIQSSGNVTLVLLNALLQSSYCFYSPVYGWSTL